MKKIFFLFASLFITMISLNASEKLNVIDFKNVKSVESNLFNFSNNEEANDFTLNYVAKKSSGSSKFFTFLKKNRNVFLGLGIGLTAGTVVGLSLGIAGAAIYSFYYTNYLTIIHSPTSLSPATALNYYYAGIALNAVGWLFFALCFPGAVASWVFFGLSYYEEKVSLNFQINANSVALVLKF